MSTITTRVFSTVAAVLFAAAAAGPAGAQEPTSLEGNWKGTLNAGGVELPLVFHVTAGENGLAATMDSPAQGAMGIPIDEVIHEGDSVVFTIRGIGGRYAGTLSDDGTTIEGTWSQGPASFPLTLTRMADGEEVSRPPRPQEPTGPLPYREEEVRFTNASAGIELAGTLTLPDGPGPFPGVVLITGSGPQDRDETLLGHKPFLVLADHLTRRGVAVLRYDDRGVAESGGDFVSATSEDLAGDALAALAYLQARPEIAGDRVGFVGHSEGGLIAPMAAGRSDAVSFVVLLAGPAATGKEIILRQGELISRAAGTPEDVIEANRSVQERIFDVVTTVDDPDAVRARLGKILREAADRLPEDQRETALARVDAQIQQVTSPWFRFFLTYDPVPALERLRVPVLALFGENDLQVPPSQNAGAMRAALARSGNPDATVVVLPGLNHLFQTSESGAPSEYQSIEETISPRALEAISDWILERFGSGR